MVSGVAAGVDRGLTMDFITYERFGVELLRLAVTPERVRSAVAGVAGDQIAVGPMTVGPGGAARVEASGRVDVIEVTAHPGDLLRFTATVPVDLELDVRVAAARHRYRGRIEVPLDLTVKTATPLRIIIDVDAIDARDVRVELSASGVRAKVLQRLGNVDDEVRQQVAAVVNERLGSESAMEARRIDVAALIDSAWDE